MSTHFKGKNGIKDYMAHEAVIVGSLRGKTSRYLFVLMLLRASSWGKVIEQPLVVGHDSPLLLNWLSLMFHAKGASIN